MKRTYIRGVLLGAAILAGEGVSTMAEEVFVFVGTYTGEKSKGIYLFTFDDEKGTLTPRGLAAQTTSPSFLAIERDGKYLFAANEVNSFEGKKGGSVSAFEIEPKTGLLKFLNAKSSGGGGPCHITTDQDGKTVLVANYGGGSVISLPVQENGWLGEPTSFYQHEGSSVDKGRQEGPHAHSINLDIDQKHAVAADLGLDKILIYKFNAEARKLEPNMPGFARTKPGGGPRHFAFHPNGKFGFTNLEMTSEVTSFRYNYERGELTELQTISTLPADYKGKGNSTAEIRAHPSGKFVYCSNRGHDSIAVFRFDAGAGTLSYVENESTQGRTPRNFGIDPSGKFIIAANQSSDSLAVLKVDERSGELSFTGTKVECPTPVCVKFLKR